jgi:hypothetical protein
VAFLILAAKLFTRAAEVIGYALRRAGNLTEPTRMISEGFQ